MLPSENIYFSLSRSSSLETAGENRSYASRHAQRTRRLPTCTNPGDFRNNPVFYERKLVISNFKPFFTYLPIALYIFIFSCKIRQTKYDFWFCLPQADQIFH